MVKLKVDGMTCGHCVKAVTKALGAAPGVERVREVSLARGEALVEGRPDMRVLSQLLVDEGYAVTLLE